MEIWPEIGLPLFVVKASKSVDDHLQQFVMAVIAGRNGFVKGSCRTKRHTKKIGMLNTLKGNRS
jgi:hypothetical protein